MNKLAVIVPVLLAASDAWAITRHDITGMSCAKVQSIVQAEGAVILRYRSPGSGMTLYDRYVRDNSFCSSGEISVRASVPTPDRPYCPVKKCITYSISDFR